MNREQIQKRIQEVKDAKSSMMEIVKKHEKELDELYRLWQVEVAKDQAKCDHYYIPTNSKWAPVNERTCQHCGHTIS